ncbi:MAG TPA: disulfide bond formation protein B [Porticoccaceae bacterium]|nr:disulfide bond formation protein B [Porticoccaceae bacterium]
MIFPNKRTLNFLAAASCAISLLIAVLYFQEYLGLEPCYLCITQRAFVAAAGAIFLIAALHNPSGRGQNSYAIAAILTSIGGAYFSGKQLWLQNLPEDSVPMCGPPVDYLFDVFPASEVITMLIRGDGNCAKVQWELLGISMPGWVLTIFIILVGVGLFQLLRRD